MPRILLAEAPVITVPTITLEGDANSPPSGTCGFLTEARMHVVNFSVAVNERWKNRNDELLSRDHKFAKGVVVSRARG